jgi:leucyl/phenylalanyl-tRNA--protein transferase
MIWGVPSDHPIFPHPLQAGEEGLLAVGDYLTPDIILTAYHFGIFPWYSEGDPLLWWHTSPRAVLFPADVKVSKSMRSLIRKTDLTCTIDQDFEGVIRSCQSIQRPDQPGTWIQEEVLAAYLHMHQLGYAHSVEVWRDDDLVGGLYGMALGKIFFGESMFTRESNASKLALIYLCRRLESMDFDLIDCQQATDHILSMGAVMIDGATFQDHLRKNRMFCLTHGDQVKL